MGVMTLIWHTHIDDRTCPICLPLNGHMWIYDMEKDPFPTKLYSPQKGIEVWDCNKDEPRPHGRHIYNCRCWLTADWNFNDIETRLASIKARALETCGSIEVWSGGKQVQVLRSHGRFVSWRKTI